jgi:hypothetical protein
MGVSHAARFLSSGFRMTEAIDEILADAEATPGVFATALRTLATYITSTGAVACRNGPYPATLPITALASYDNAYASKAVGPDADKGLPRLRSSRFAC